ncbi:hypothetical protein CUJ83_12520 [Methanocella sp. CWC-04]|uniref:Uncharacterized protein n=2 Tax=Methanooceanicella nereidis TaxID=2052831 RepID=A0AAP2RFV3_9EURY|nr:hypothetical protein [Methanocella sp. CWC-04]
MIKIEFPHKTYSENKIKIKQIIKKYGMSWDDKKSGWVNEATGDGVYIDKSVIEMILNDSFSDKMPMTLFIRSDNSDFIKEMEAKCNAIGGIFVPDQSSYEAPEKPVEQERHVESLNDDLKTCDVFVKLNMRDHRDCNHPAFLEKAYTDLQDISGRWDRRKEQLVWECSRLGMDRSVMNEHLQREEIIFRKNNACWITGEFPSDKKSANIDVIVTDEQAE